VKYAIHILNRCPTKTLDNIVLEEAWIERKLDISHIRIFGYIAYAHVPDKLRQKLNDKSEKCIFLCYYDQSKVYLLYNPVTRKVVIIKDVKFSKEEAWDGSVQKIVKVVETEQGAEEDDPIHALAEQDHE